MTRPDPAQGFKPIPPASPTETADSLETEANHRDSAIASARSRNLVALAMYQIALRISWIFKTESVIMPAFLDAIAGPGWLRGFLPTLNRFGQSVPPLLFADRLKHMPIKKRALAATVVLMAVPFLILSALWFGLEAASVHKENRGWLPFVFLGLYTFFFSMTGLNQLSFSTLQGKLIPATRRGRLMMLASLTGSICAITCAWFFLRTWLKRPGGGFGEIFLITAIGFLISAFIATLAREPKDDYPPRPSVPLTFAFERAWKTFKSDADFRRLAYSTMLFMTALMLFPHYQALGREKLGCQPSDLLTFLIAQNAGAGVFSVVTGTLADRFGNRLCLRFCMFTSATAPLVAIGLADGWIPGGRASYFVTFLVLGLTPITLRCLVNYALELVHESEHASHVSALTMIMAMPFVFSPLVGGCVDAFGFAPVFLFVAALILTGAFLTFRLIEPRHRVLSSGTESKAD